MSHAPLKPCLLPPLGGPEAFSKSGGLGAAKSVLAKAKRRLRKHLRVTFVLRKNTTHLVDHPDDYDRSYSGV